MATVALALPALALAAYVFDPATAGAAPPSAAPADPLALLAVQQAQLSASNGAAGDHFGFAVAISGDTALVGAPDKTVGGNVFQGVAYVFTRAGTAGANRRS